MVCTSQTFGWYITNRPGSALAQLARGGVEYLRARTPVPSDSFPGMVGQVTGGDPSVTGVYYDASYNHSLLPPGTTTCPHGVPTGTVVNHDESIDKDSTSIDAGQGLAGLPGSILQMTGSPQTLINPAALGDHRLGQARPVADRPERPDPHPRRSDRRCDQRRMDGGAPGRRGSDRRGDQRRRVPGVSV